MISTVGQYKVLERLGDGALGDVFRARDTRAGRTIALMVPPPELIAGPVRRRRFLEDARRAATLNHPNIAMLFDVLEQDDRCYLAYEFAAGPALSEEMESAPLDVAHALHLAAHIADALAEGHAKGMVHGDLRPDTIVVTPKGSVKVLNFGMTKWTRELSPEQALAVATDAGGDLLALGLILGQMLTGRQPGHMLTPPSAVNRDVPTELDAVAMKLLKTGDEGYQTAAAVATDLRGVSAALDRKQNERRRRRAWWKGPWILLGVVGAVFVLPTHTTPATTAPTVNWAPGDTRDRS